MIHSYSSIHALGHREVKDILNGDVVVEEKIDGSQISFGVDLQGELHIRSKGKALVLDHPEKMFAIAVEMLQGYEKFLQPGYTYRGEYLQKPKHNALAYSRVPRHHIILFDIDSGNQNYLSPEEKQEEAETLGFEVVPVFFEGRIESLEALKGLLNGRESVLGGVEPEGVVIKQYDQFGADHKVLMAKYVTEAYKEKHKQSWGVSNPRQGDVVKKLTDELRTEARWEKAIQHLREAGLIDDAPQDIGKLMKEVNLDVLKEEKQQIMEDLFDWAWPQISRGITAGLPQWYKDRIAASAFEGVGT